MHSAGDTVALEILIEAARGGSREARGQLFQRYGAYLRLLARATLGRRLRAKVDASDVVQETLLAAHEDFGGFRGGTERELAGWLRRVLSRKVSEQVRRFARNQGRDVGRERSMDGAVDSSSNALRGVLAGSGTTPSGCAERRELGVVLTDALDELEPDHREVIVLRNLEALDWREVGERMGRTPDAARMLWARAVTRLRPRAEGLR